MPPSQPGRVPGRSRPRVELLEGRDVPAALLGLTTDNQLVRFDSAAPGTLIGAAVPVTGLAVGENLVGIDYRPATGQLYAVGSSSQVYTINAATGAATAVGGTFTPALDPAATGFGVDFNPVADRLRVIAGTGQSLRIDPTTGAATADTDLFFDPADPQNQGFFGTSGGPITPAPQVVAVGYTRNLDIVTGSPVTTLYGIDAGQDLFVRIGGPDGDPTPNNGQTVVVDQLRDAATFAVVDFGPDAAFDIQPLTDAAFASNGSALYSVNITNGAVTPLGTVAGTALRGLAIVPAEAGAGTVSLSTTAATFPADRGPLVVTVTRTGGTADAATVNFATADGTAVAGVDYLPTSGTLTFNPGETSRQIVLLVPGTTPPVSPEKTFTLTLSSPGGGATLGTNTAATITIPAVSANPGPGQTPAPAATRFFAAAGGGQVFVFDSAGGTATPAFTLTPFGAGFNGVIGVATGDVTGDGTDDIIAGAGPGGAPRIQVIDGANRAVLADFFAYESTFRGGVYVAAGDVNGDGQADVIAGTGNGGGPRVQVFSGRGLTGSNQTTLANFFTVESTFRGGVTVGSGEFTGDSRADILAGTGVGGGARVQVFSGAAVTNAAGTGASGAAPTAAVNFLAYADPFRGGVFVAGGDVNGDGFDDIVTGVGSGGGPNVIAFSGSGLTGGNQTRLGSFFAYPQTGAGSSAGVRVGVLDPFADGASPIATGAGTGGTGAVRFFTAAGASAGTDLNPFAAGFDGGVFVG